MTFGRINRCGFPATNSVLKLGSTPNTVGISRNSLFSTDKNSNFCAYGNVSGNAVSEIKHF